MGTPNMMVYNLGLAHTCKKKNGMEEWAEPVILYPDITSTVGNRLG